MRPLRLAAQDVGFSARKQGFKSPRGYLRKSKTGDVLDEFYLGNFFRVRKVDADEI